MAWELKNTAVYSGPEQENEVSRQSWTVRADGRDGAIMIWFNRPHALGESRYQLHIDKADFAELTAAMNAAMAPEPEEG